MGENTYTSGQDGLVGPESVHGSVLQAHCHNTTALTYIQTRHYWNPESMMNEIPLSIIRSVAKYSMKYSVLYFSDWPYSVCKMA